MIKTTNLQKIFRKEEEKTRMLNKKVFFYLLLFLIVVACGKNRRPGLSDKELFAQKETTDTIRQAPVAFDAETYVVPPGIKYKESRAVDPANPPVVIDIANRKLNVKKFDLGEYYSTVRYIKLKHPMPETEGNFLLDADYHVTFEQGMASGHGFKSQFKFTDDFILAGDAFFGLHCYDKEGRFLFTIESNNFPKVYNISPNTVSYNASDFKGYSGGVTINGNNCLYNVNDNNKNFLCLYDLTQKKRIMSRPSQGRVLFLDDKSMASYVYDPLDTTRNFLFTFDLKGDTLCRFPSYHPVPEIGKGSYPSPPSSNIYHYNKQLTIRQTLNDTVYRVVSANRLLPAYVLNFGAYRADVQTFFRENLSEKLLPYTWIESDSYILFVYTKNRDSYNNRKDRSVRFFYSYYDKKNRQLYHFSEGTTVPEEEFFMENPIPDALPFLLSYVNITDSQLMVFYSKKRLESMSKNKGFASLSLEQQNKLKTIQNELDESEVLIMILE